MSFPYTTTSPPPTSGALTVVDKANVSQSYAGGGGGGGGGGPNPQVSSLSVNDSGNVLMTWNNGGATLNFGFEATNTSSFILQQGIGVSGTKVAGPEGCIQVLEKDGGANQVFAPLQASGFEVCATAYPGGAFAGLYFSSIGSVLYSAVGQPLTIDAPAGVSVSSLTVSSINGAAPGGGGSVGPNPTFSTITFNNASALYNLSSITPYPQALSIDDGAGGAAVEFNLANANAILAISASGGNGGTLTSIANDVDLIIQSAGGNNNIVIDGPTTTISSLTVSSINGGAPGGGGNSYPLPSTLKKGDAVGLALNASSLTTLAAFSTISSHFYTVSVDITPRQLTQTFGPIDAYQSQLTTDDGLVNILNNGLWSEVSTLYNSALSITPGLGGSATFKAGGSNMTVDVYNTYSNFLSTNLNAIFAVDHGPGP